MTPTQRRIIRCFDPVQQKILISKAMVCIESTQGEFHSRLPSIDIFQHLLVDPANVVGEELGAIVQPLVVAL